MSSSQIFGDWGKLKHVLNKLANNGDQYDYIVIGMGEKIAERIWDLIESESIYLEPLKQDYLQRKISEGYDERTLIKTGDFLNSIQVTDIQSDGDNLTVFIGVEDGTTETGISMQELAYYIEEGTVNQPARKPFLRSWEAMKAEIKSEVSSRLKAEIGGVLR